MKNALHTISLLSILFCFYVSAFASGIVDETFNPAASKGLTFSSSMGVIVQADGKNVIWGANFVVDGQAKGNVVRLNVDGTVDSGFSYCGCLLASVTNALQQADGKLLLAGTDNGQLPRVVRLNADGTSDNSYQNGLAGQGFQNATAQIFLIQPDGKPIVAAFGVVNLPTHQGILQRLNTDGSNDASFAHILYDNNQNIRNIMRDVAIDSAGRIYTAVTTIVTINTLTALKRYTATGAVDGTWAVPAVSVTSGTTCEVLSMDIDGSDRLLISGRFDRVNGIDILNLARIMPAGNVDLTFTRPASVVSSSISQVKAISLSRYLINAGGRLYRLINDGSIDDTFVFPTASIADAYDQFVVGSFGQITFFGQATSLEINLFRLYPDGGIDAAISALAKITAIARQPDDKVILAGDFRELNGVSRRTIARANVDGTTDPSFNGGTGFSTPPTSLIVQPDGKILAAGTFTGYNGTTQGSLLRLNSDGSIDGTFTPTVTGVSEISLQSDGRILVFGNFTTVNSTPRTAVARLETNGTLDATFGVVFPAGANVNSAQQLANGQYIVGGIFGGVDGFSRPNLVRLNSNGTLDQSFNASGAGAVLRIIAQPDGKFVILTSSTISRRNADGSADTAFSPHTFSADSGNAMLSSALLLSNGSIIVGGEFNVVDLTRRNSLVRFNATGQLDKLFMPLGTDRRVVSLVAQPDDKVLIGGDFTRIGTSLRTGIARMIPGNFTGTTPFDFDGDGKTDFTVLRPSATNWYQISSSTGQFAVQQFYAASDVVAPADYDGDGKTDYGVFRPSTGDWWYLSSINGGAYAVHWGQSGDIPEPADVEGDGRADFRVYRPSTGVWYTFTQLGVISSPQFGSPSDKPVNGDFDGDGKADPAIFRPSTGDWWYLSSIDGVSRAAHWGISTDIPAAADFDGDGTTDRAVYRNGVWYILNSSDQSFTGMQFGIAGDKPVPADYDGDGKADIAVFRPNNGTWYVWGTTSGFFGLQFGANGDVPAPNAYLPQ